MANIDSSRMPDLFGLLYGWWKQMLLVIVLSLIVVATVLYLKPRKYLSVTTALPAPTYATDKAAIFSDNIQLLYPGIGTPDDLDKIVGTAQLDTVYHYVVDQLALIGFYGFKKKMEKPAIKLRPD